MKLFYRKYGSGPPLVILHGLYGSSDNWVSIASKLSNRFTVILPDLRNHGQSPHSQIHTYESMADDLLELARDLRLSEFMLAGHSMGGKVAIAFALRFPEMLNGLVVVDISPFGSASESNPFFVEHHKILESILAARPEEQSTRADVEKILAMNISSERTRSFIMKNLRRSAGGKFEWKLNAPALYQNLASITDGVAERNNLPAPVTGFPVIFLKGSDSDYIDPSYNNDIVKLFPAAEIITIQGTGHWIHADKPDETAEIFLSLLEGN